MSEIIMNYTIENSSPCDSSNYPAVSAYIRGGNIYGVAAICVGSLAFLCTIFLFIDTSSYVIRYSSSKVKAHTIYIIAVYPVTCLANILVIVVPRAQVVSEALIQVIFMCGMYQLFCLYVSYGGGQEELLNKLQPYESIKTAPRCCWECFSFVPTLNVTKTVTYLRLLILQLPIIQGFIYIILLVIWAENKIFYHSIYSYAQIVLVFSIIFGVWGMFMTINLFGFVLEEEFDLSRKFRIFRMVLIFSKLQGLIIKIFVWSNVLPCDPPMTQMTYANLIHNTLMATEMLFLSVLTRSEYKRDLPGTIKRTSATRFMENIKNIGTISIKDKQQDQDGYDNQTCDISVEKIV